MGESTPGNRIGIGLYTLTETSSVHIWTKTIAFASSTLLTLGSSPAMAQPESHVQMSAAVDYQGYNPGDSGLLAITFVMDEDWHIYWPGVSDSGFGVEFDIKFDSDLITLEDPIWPTPERYLQPGDILDHIYEGTATVLFPFKVAKDAEDNQAIDFEIDADFLVCADVCLPGKASASTASKIVYKPEDKHPTASQKDIQTLYDNKPKVYDPDARNVRTQWIPDMAAIMIQGADKIEFFPSTECSEIVNLIEDGTTDSDRLLIHFVSSKDNVLSGRLRATGIYGVVDYDIDIKPPK